MKQIQKTQEINDLLRAAFGADADTANLAVFEAIALNNLPLRKKHPLYEGAVAQDTMLREITAAVNSESQPLQIMHDTGALPTGRVFAARMNGQEVRALFAVNQQTHPQLVADLDSGMIDQVSVNVLPRQILCSECGFDYLGPEATIDNIWNATCANDHKLRVDGVHANLNGLSHLAEISLVNKGGAQNARILSNSQSLFAAEPFQRLAASGHAPALLLADLTPDTSTQGKPKTMELAELVAQLTDAKVSVATLTSERDTAVAARDSLQAELTAANERVTALEAEVAELKGAEQPECPAAVLAFLQDLAKRTQIALGNQTPTVGDKPDELIASIKEGQSQLSALIPPGGAALTADTRQGDGKSAAHASSAFRTSGNR